jgi:hypothetical protein
LVFNLFHENGIDWLSFLFTMKKNFWGIAKVIYGYPITGNQIHTKLTVYMNILQNLPYHRPIEQYPPVALTIYSNVYNQQFRRQNKNLGSWMVSSPLDLWKCSSFREVGALSSTTKLMCMSLWICQLNSLKKYKYIN